MAESTRSRVGGLTTSGRLRTLLTVPTDTPARAATSRMLVVSWSSSGFLGDGVVIILLAASRCLPYSLVGGGGSGLDAAGQGRPVVPVRRSSHAWVLTAQP